MDLLSLSLGGLVGAGFLHLATRTREYQTTRYGVADLLGWEAIVDDGIVVQTDGALLTGWSLRGEDMHAASAAERNEQARQLNDALKPFTDGWMFHVDVIRRRATAYAPPGAFPDPITRLLDEERRVAYTGSTRHPEGGEKVRRRTDPRTETPREDVRHHAYGFSHEEPVTGAAPSSANGPQIDRRDTPVGLFETETILVATYLPDPAVYHQLGRLFVRGRNTVRAELDAILDGFLEHRRRLELRLGLSLNLERLPTDALLKHLHESLTGETHPVTVPPSGLSLASYLGDQQLFGGFAPRIGPVHGGRHIRCVGIHGFPAMTTPGLLDGLHQVPAVYRWSTRIIMMSRPVAEKFIRRRQLEWSKKRKGAGAQLRRMLGTSSPDAQHSEGDVFDRRAASDMTQDTAEAIRSLDAGTAAYAAYTSTAVVLDADPDRADRAASALRKRFVQRGFPARIEDLNALDAFLGSLPGNAWANRRRYVLQTQNIADLLPATTPWAGRATCPSPLFPSGAPALLWTATDGDTPFRVNLHTTGDVGHTLIVGATGAGKSVLVNLLLAQWQRYAGAQSFLFDLGGSGYLLAKAMGGKHLDVTETTGFALQPLAHIDEPAERRWAATWCETLLELAGLPVTPSRRAELHRALDIVAHDPPAMRTLAALHIQVQDTAIRTVLREVSRGGPYGALLDGIEDGRRSTAAHTVFEMGSLRELTPSVFVPVLLCLFRRIERRLRADRPTLIVLEEVWSALLEGPFAARIRQWLLTLRKENAAVVLVAHSPAQIAELDQREIVIESCPTKICLPNAEARDPETARLYHSLGLTDRAIETLAGAVPKRQYLLSSPAGWRLFNVDLGPVARALLTPPDGAGYAEVRREVEALEAVHGPLWRTEWLRRRGVDVPSDRAPTDLEWASVTDWDGSPPDGAPPDGAPPDGAPPSTNVAIPDPSPLSTQSPPSTQRPHPTQRPRSNQSS